MAFAMPKSISLDAATNHKEIGGLQVAVHNALFVYCVHRLYVKGWVSRPQKNGGEMPIEFQSMYFQVKIFLDISSCTLPCS